MTTEKNSTYDVFLMIAPGLAKIIAVVAIAIVGIFVVLPNLTGTTSKLDESSVPTLVRDFNPMFGKKDANITVVEFFDFQCPGCKSLSPVIKQVREEYKNEVRFVSKMFPLPMHANSDISAKSAMAAAKQGKYFEFSDKLFAYQDTLGLSQRTQEQVAVEIGLDMNQWNNDRKSKEIEQQIAWDMADGKNAILPLKEGSTETGPIDSTPTLVFMRGDKIMYKTNGLSSDELKANLDRLLN